MELREEKKGVRNRRNYHREVDSCFLEILTIEGKMGVKKRAKKKVRWEKKTSLIYFGVMATIDD